MEYTIPGSSDCEKDFGIIVGNQMNIGPYAML